jgi:hypothetical protein
MAVNSKDIREEANAARANVPEALQADLNAHLNPMFGGATTDGALTASQASNLAAYAKDERGLAEGGALSSSQIHVTGAGAEKGLGVEKEAARKRAKAGRESSYLAILQAQLDQLAIEIERLNNEIEDILDPHLTDDERAYLDGIENPEEKAHEQMRIAREKVESGDMPPAEFDRFEVRWEERKGIHAEHDRVKNIIENGSPEQIMEAAQNEEIERLQLARDAIETETRGNVEATLNERDRDGRTDMQNTTADFGAFEEGISLGEEGPQVSLLGGGSVAAQVMPGDNPNVKMPALKAEFVNAHGMQESTEPAPQSEEPKTEEDPSFVAKGTDAPGYPAG